MKKLLLLLAAVGTLALSSCSTDSLTGPQDSQDVIRVENSGSNPEEAKLPPVLPPQKSKKDVHDNNTGVTAETK